MQLHDNNLPEADGSRDENIEENKPEIEENKESLDENSRNSEELNTSKDEYDNVPFKDYKVFSPASLVDELDHLLSHYPVNLINNAVRAISNEFNKKVREEEKKAKANHIAEGKEERDFYFKHPEKFNFQKVFNEFKKQRSAYYKNQEESQKTNLEKRNQLIEDLKKLYTDFNDNNHELFKEFRRIKSEWHDAGRVPAAEASNVFRNYYHHLDNFYEYLNLNKELQSLDYDHNLETRKNIIQRAEALLNEDNIRKSLNELQYLHKLWKEEAVPVAEEHREPTWNAFKEITQKIHDKKNDFYSNLREKEVENESIKNEIIQKIKEINSNIENSHNFFQKTLKEVESLRKNFISTGKAPRSVNQKIWDEFKQELRAFNKSKNKFYKEMKNSQTDNLKRKQELLQQAKDNVDRDDWEEAVAFFKEIQQEWKNVGMVPRKQSNDIWKEFNETCNRFFDRFKSRNAPNQEKLNENFENKKTFLEELYPLNLDDLGTEEAESKLFEINSKWNELGRVPQSEKSIENKFMDLLNQKLKESKHDFNLKDLQSKLRVNNIKQQGDEEKLNDLLRKLKSQMDDIRTEIGQLENNLSYFANSNKDNPLLKNVHKEIAEKNNRLSNLQEEYRQLRNINFEEAPSEEEKPADSSEE